MLRLQERELPRFATAWIAILQEKLARLTSNEPWKEDVVWLANETGDSPCQMLMGGFRSSSP
ncbi:hypothetical protein P0D87_28420 [Paraburkholderia sp. RL17-368-BIF-A]|jgi:hypothetical protein|uniref:hypothetical protein n=1 Tax=Paraburkholderia sp. RL17-368-BIF-A TaxID=3031628 RepID=UPI0006B3EBCD|nr:hypothetical protein AC233_25940 [Burkholderia sp. HB1]